MESKRLAEDHGKNEPEEITDSIEAVYIYFRRLEVGVFWGEKAR